LFDAASKAEAMHTSNHRKVSEGLGVTIMRMVPGMAMLIVNELIFPKNQNQLDSGF
jgi:hypothetical protein